MSVRRKGLWEAREFQVKATTLAFPFGEQMIQVFHDVSDHNRRELLEQTFLHDLANSLMSLSTWSELMSQGVRDPATAAARIMAITTQLADVVNQQRLLAQAEKGDLEVRPRNVDVGVFLEALRQTLSSNPLFRSKGLTLKLKVPGGAQVLTDPTILSRVLANMGINAIEACQPGETVQLGFGLDYGTAKFTVHNPGAIPETVSLQIFQRSFSTKATKGRGLGTYSLKVLGENAVGGKVGFTSRPGLGTEFHLHLPCDHQA